MDRCKSTNQEWLDRKTETIANYKQEFVCLSVCQPGIYALVEEV